MEFGDLVPLREGGLASGVGRQLPEDVEVDRQAPRDLLERFAEALVGGVDGYGRRGLGVAPGDGVRPEQGRGPRRKEVRLHLERQRQVPIPLRGDGFGPGSEGAPSGRARAFA